MRRDDRAMLTDRVWLFGIVAVLLFLVPAPRALAGTQVQLSQGEMEYHWLVDDSGQAQGASIPLRLPLKKTTVRAELSGFVARVTVQQLFANPGKHRIEAIYKFPLPVNAAVHASSIRIGKRVIVAEIREREQARKTYEKAKAQGKRTALLEQERPNIFTQSVANIGPGEEIVVALQYVQELKYDDGSYTFAFPMTVGPRFIPGTPTGRSGTGSSADTTAVSDASRITPPMLPPQLRSGHEIELTVRVAAGFPLRHVASPSHDVGIEWIKPSECVVTLAPQDRIPNKDFVLRYTTAGPKLETALLAHRSGDTGYFLLMMQPPTDVPVDEAVPKELVFVLDCSGSMFGQPMETSKAVMKKFVAGMNPRDTFQVIRFSESASALAMRPLPNTAENRARGLRYIDGLQGSGGTMMIEGIKAALSIPRDPERQRMVFFLTDGYIGNDDEILAEVRERVQDTRIYSLGVGSSPNRYLVDGMAHEGHGLSQYVRLDEDPAPIVDRFYRRLNVPVLTSIETDWGGLEVLDPLPGTVPDLFDQQPVFLVGRYKVPGHGTVRLRGRRGTGWVEVPVDVTLPAEEKDNGALSLLWARRKIAELMRLQVRGEISEIRSEVLALALEHHLMSKYTSFVAVERELKEGVDLPLDTVLIPSEMPQGVSFEGNFGAPRLSMQRVKPGDPILAVRAPEDARAVLARFPFGLQKALARDPESGLWTCRFLVPRGEKEGHHTIRVHIVLEKGDWIETSVDYVVDSTPPRFEVTAEQDGRHLRFRARPLSGVFDALSDRVRTADVRAVVLPDVMSLVVRPPQGGYVVLRQNVLEEPDGVVWEGTYDLPDWYRPGRYTFRFLAMDAARNTSTREVVVDVRGTDRASR